MKRTLARFLILVAMLAGLVFAGGGNSSRCSPRDCCTDCALARFQCNQACGGNAACKQGCTAAYNNCRRACGVCA
jgi:hypothetical protein